MKNQYILFALLFFISCNAETQVAENQVLTQKSIAKDIAYLDNFLKENSSYHGLNNFDVHSELQNYLSNLEKEKSNSVEDFGIFLLKTIGQIGDRHANVRGFRIKNDHYLPFTVAPLEDRVVALTFNEKTQEYQLFQPDFPFLTDINGFPIEYFTSVNNPEEIKAPKEAYFTRAVRNLKNIERNYKLLEKEMPAKFEFIFSNAKNDTLIEIPLETDGQKHSIWEDKFVRQYDKITSDALYNTPKMAAELFQIKDDIAYFYLPEMWRDEETPILFEALNNTMQQARETKAIIVDVRGNPGGKRDLIWQLANYFIHPDSIYVVNVAQQRGKRKLDERTKRGFNRKYLFAFDQLDAEEQAAVKYFEETFQPIYKLKADRYSESYYSIFNGKKLSKGSYHYQQPIYILINERSFSAASVLAAVFKDIPNIQLVGVTTDGSSGNSERYNLPNSKLRGKISTMVSFQKNGELLDGYGTKPDIKIQRDLDHLLWKKDAQLEGLKKLILGK